MNKARTTAFGIVMIVASGSALAQQSRWASPDDAAAKFMIGAERQWAEAACNHNTIAQQILADDFQGTSTEGTRYTKPEEIADNADMTKSASDCKLLDARVRFFGDSIAIIYGGESRSTRKDGKAERRCQVWTDTWLRRNGKWHVVAAHDAPIACK